MNTKVLSEKIGEITERLGVLADLSTAENRDFTTDENIEFENGIAEVERLKVSLEAAKKVEQFRKDAAATSGAPVVSVSKEEAKAKENYSFTNAVRMAITGRMEGLEGELSQEGQKEMERMGQTVMGVVVPAMIIQERAIITESGIKQTQLQSFVDAVYANTILGDLGITKFSTVDDSMIPILGEVTTEWAAETADAIDGGAVSTNKTLSPRRLAAFLDYGKQAAMRVSQSYEAVLVSSIQKAIAAKVEKAAFTDETGVGGYANISAGKTALTAASYTALALDLIEQVMSNNHDKGNLGFAASTEAFGALMVAAQIASVNPLVVNDAIMGRKLRFSNQMAQIAAKDAVYYGDFSCFQMAQFGGIEILADPYTQARKAVTRLVINSYWDAALVQGAAISVGTLT